MNKIKVGIFFGGPSREREISFAGGRTVYDNLNKSIFEPIPIFVDSHLNCILLDWSFLYKGTIRDFFPPVSYLPDSPHGFQVYQESLYHLTPEQSIEMLSQIGRVLSWKDIQEEIDLAFLALHGLYGEDGQIQAQLTSMGIPYTGSGLLSCALGMDKAIQKKFMAVGGFSTPTILEIKREAWTTGSPIAWFDQVQKSLGEHFVIRPANQGSSIGVSILKNPDLDTFTQKVDAAFFRKSVHLSEWSVLTAEQKVQWVRNISDIRDGLGFPMYCQDTIIHHPEQLLTYLDSQTGDQYVILSSHWTEQKVIVESFIAGREFSCIVIRNEDGSPTALPPTEIRKNGELYDYKSKYLPGLSRKITPIDLPSEQIQAIREECERLYSYLGFGTYARIDGFIQADGTILLNDPNTTSGMMPSSFFFHQAAEIGLNPSQFLSYIIRASLFERSEEWLIKNHCHTLLQRLDTLLAQLQSSASQKKKVAVFLGGYSFERHISVESGRNIFEKLASSDQYEPIPIFVAKHPTQGHELYQIPINLLLKDNADDIYDKIKHFDQHPLIAEIQGACQSISDRFKQVTAVDKPVRLSYEALAGLVDFVFIALHGRPGEDGEVQARLDKVGLPYNGSPAASAQITINKFETLERLRALGMPTAQQHILAKTHDFDSALKEISAGFSFPFVAKPVDDGCSSAVMVIKNQDQFKKYLAAIFRDEDELTDQQRQDLGLAYNEEFPKKSEVLIESLINKGEAAHFLEITGGLLTHYLDGDLTFEMFEPSEALSSGEVLSLEEKFLAGEGQNITPARYDRTGKTYYPYANAVKADLEKAATALGVEGYARIDAFVRIYPDDRVETIVIEVNSLPGMTPATCIFHQCAINGYKPYEFIDKIIQFGIQRHDKK
jgi:UDP-N-acetylmuramate--alanine ligase